MGSTRILNKRNIIEYQGDCMESLEQHRILRPTLPDNPSNRLPTSRFPMLLDRALPSFSNLLGSHKPPDRLWLLVLWSCLLLLGRPLRLRTTPLMGGIQRMPREGRLGFGKVVVLGYLFISTD